MVLQRKLTEKKFFKRGEWVDFLYIDVKNKECHFEENCQISNSTFEDFMLKDQPPRYYFLNSHRNIQAVWIPANQVYEKGSKKSKLAKILYAK